MQHQLLHFFRDHPDSAILISIFASILLAVIGVLPSVFITAANILFFGFWNGTFISFLGESIGAGIAFLLYRKGFKKTVDKSLQKYPNVKRLATARGKDAFYLVFSLRLIPFVPSGLITFAASVGSMSFYSFLVASSLGKFPALLMEAWSVYEVTRFGWIGKTILLLCALGLMFWAMRKKK